MPFSMKFFICFFWFVSVWGYAQTWEENLQKGLDLQEQSEYKEAQKYLEQAIKLAEKSKNFENYWKAKTFNGLNLLKINQLELAKSYLQSNITALSDLEKIVKHYPVISRSVYYWKIQNEYFLAEAHLNLGKYDEAREIVETNSRQLSASSLANQEQLAGFYNLLGIIFWQEGKNNLALEYIEKGLDIRKKNALPAVSASYNDLGLVYQDIDKGKALEFYQKAYESYQKQYPEIHPKNAIVLSNIGIIKVSQQAYEEAKNYFEKSLSIWKQIYPLQSHPSEAFVLNNIGRVFSEQKKYETAQEYFFKALKIYEANYGKKHPEVAKTYNLLAKNFLDAGEYKNALSSVQEGIIANSTQFNLKEVSHNPASTDFMSFSTALYSLFLKANILREQYITKTVRLKDLNNALSTLEIADTLLNNLRQKASSKADKILLGQVSAQIYEEAVKTCYLLANETFRKEKFFTKAFYFSEKAKAIVLLEAISESRAKSFGNIPDDLLKKEESLRQSITFIEQQIALKPDENQLNAYKAQLFELNREYERFQKNLEQNYPNYFQLKYSSKPVELKSLQATLSKDMLLLDYVIGETEIFVFIVSNNKIELLSLPKIEDFEGEITALLNGIRLRVGKVFTKQAHLIYKSIFPKNISKKVKHIVVIQDGKLAVLPMEALLSESVDFEKNGNYHSYPYLLRKYAFSYGYSATLWYDNIRKEKVNKTPSVNLIAPVTFESNVSSLPATENEVKEIAMVCRQKNYDVRTLLFQEAQEKTIKTENLQNYSVLHFATHGYVDEESPELSQIYLSKDDLEDGNLFMGEIFNLRMNADLVTLSACEVGLGKISKGEGVIGLGRAFLYAGAKNLIISLWRISDDSTARLMILFYTHYFLQNSPNYAFALQKAKLEILAMKQFERPYYWAAFLLLGK